MTKRNASRGTIIVSRTLDNLKIIGSLKLKLKVLKLIKRGQSLLNNTRSQVSKSAKIICSQ